MIDLAIAADHILTVVNDYAEAHPEEKDGLAPVVDLLAAGADLTSRKEFRGHATAGAVLAGPDGRVLHIRHLALDAWLLPGGHLEPEDESLQGAALRELTEETGIPAEAVTPVGDRPVHIDVHPIPANHAKDEPAHRHADFRFLFRTAATGIGRLQAEEVTGAAWRDVAALRDERLRRRVGEALR